MIDRQDIYYVLSLSKNVSIGILGYPMKKFPSIFKDATYNNSSKKVVSKVHLTNLKCKFPT